MIFVLGHSDIGYEANITGGVYRDELDETMLNNSLITAVCRTLDNTELVLDITLNESKDIEVLGIINHNLSTSGTYQWECFSDILRTVSVYDTGVINVYEYNKDLIHPSTCDALDRPITNVFWRLTINDTNAFGYMEIGRLFMGERFVTGCNLSQGYKFGVQTDNTVRLESSIGIEVFPQSVKIREAYLPFDQEEYDVGLDYTKLSLSNGISDALLFEFDPAIKNKGIHTMICRQQAISAIDYPFHNINNFSIHLKEII